MNSLNLKTVCVYLCMCVCVCVTQKYTGRHGKFCFKGAGLLNYMFWISLIFFVQKQNISTLRIDSFLVAPNAKETAWCSGKRRGWGSRFDIKQQLCDPGESTCIHSASIPPCKRGEEISGVEFSFHKLSALCKTQPTCEQEFNPMHSYPLNSRIQRCLSKAPTCTQFCCRHFRHMGNGLKGLAQDHPSSQQFCFMLYLVLVNPFSWHQLCARRWTASVAQTAPAGEVHICLNK